MPEYGIHNYVKCKKAPEFVTKETLDKSYKSIKKAAKAFENNETLKKLGWNKDFEMFTDKFIEFVDKDPNIHRITSADVHKFQSHLKIWDKGINKGFGKFLDWKVLEARLQHLPNGRELAKRVKEIVNHQRRHTQINEGFLETIRSQTEKLAEMMGVKTPELAEIESRLFQAKDETSRLQAENDFVNHLGSLKNGKDATAAGNLYHGIRDALEGTPVKNLTNPDGSKWGSKEQAIAQNIKNAWIDIRKDMLKVTVNALRMEKEVARKIDIAEGGRRGLENHLDTIDSIIKKLELSEKVTGEENTGGREYDLNAKDMHDLGITEKSTYFLENRKSYMPHVLLRTAQHLKEFNGYMFENTLNKPDAQFKDFVDYWKMQGTPDRAKGRGAVNDPYYSRNPYFFIKSYITELTRYNHERSMQNVLLDTQAKLLKSKDFAKGTTNEAYVDEIIDNGLSLITTLSDAAYLGGSKGGYNDFSGKMTRLMTAMGFTRAMAGSLRTAGRNYAGGRFLNWMEHGWGYHNIGKEYIKNAELSNDMTRELERYGLTWHKDSTKLRELVKLYRKGILSQGGAAATRGAIEEGALPPGMKEIKLENGESRIIVEEMGAFEKVVNTVEAVAGAGSVFHQKVENMLRPMIFQSAFAVAHKNIMAQPEWYTLQQMGRNRDSFGGNELKMKQAMSAYATKRAGRHAQDAVTLSQFEYHDVAKARVLTSKKGKTIGQFKHYMFELMNWRYKTAREGLIAINAARKSGEFGRFNPKGEMTDAQIMKFYRMGIGVTLSNALTMLTGLGINHLLSSEDIEFFTNNLKIMLADPNTEEGQKTIKEASYGHGLASNLGITFSTTLEFAKLMQWLNIDETNKFIMASVTEGEPMDLEDEKWRNKMVGLVNLQAARAMKSVPEAVRGNPMKALMTESALYMDYEDHKKREEYLHRIGKVPGLGWVAPKKKKRRKKRDIHKEALQSLRYLK